VASTERVVGRGAELAMIVAFLDDVRDRPSALLISGEPGIGKSTLWEAGVAGGQEHGYRLLSTRPAEAECKLAYAGLADLLGDVLDEVRPALTDPQQRALDVALLREGAPSATHEPRAVAAAVLASVTSLVDEGPVLFTIDDAQWLDHPTRSALTFALRRLNKPVGVIATTRLGEGAADPLDLKGSFGSDNLERIRLRPLSMGALQGVLRLHLDRVPPRPLLAQIHRACRGNPFWGIEVGRAVVEGEIEVRPGEPLAIPDDLGAALRRRLAKLPQDARGVLLAAASLASPDVHTLEEALGEASFEALEVLVRLGIVQVDGERVRFTHPLFASTAYWMSASSRRRQIHGALASVVRAPEERARHLALAAPGPDARTADALDIAAADARARGASETAAELAELACTATPSEAAELKERRRSDAAWYLADSGDLERAIPLAEEAAQLAPPGPTRAVALKRLGLLTFNGTAESVTRPIFERALEQTTGYPLLEADLRATLAAIYSDLPQEASRHAHTALELLEREAAPPPVLLSWALTSVAVSDFMLGRGIQTDLERRAIELEQDQPGEHLFMDAGLRLSVVWLGSGALDRARTALERAIERTRAYRGEEGLPGAVVQLADLEIRAGNWARAETHASALREYSQHEPGSDSRALHAADATALVASHIGRVNEARQMGQIALELSESFGDHLFLISASASLGRLDLALGDSGNALDHLGRADALVRRRGYGEPGLWTFHGDLIEALVLEGALDRAEAYVTELEERGRSLDRPFALALAARGWGILMAHRGNFMDGFPAFERAMREHDRVAMPYERARTLFFYGRALRRSRKWGEARRRLGEALAIFEQLGAQLQVDRTRDELRRIGGRAPGPQELTHSERRVAETIAAGRTTREAAELLFVSPRTVEAVLSTIYGKLGIHSRAELGRAMRTPRADSVDK
jgi:DNA-binding CsgD family transcriptional regulator/tetratricopeptide (TPR) repeat protein